MTVLTKRRTKGASKHALIINHKNYRRIIQRLGLSPNGVGYAEQVDNGLTIVTFFAFVSVTCGKNIIANFNDHNRIRSRKQAIDLTEARKRGEWCFNGVPLVFASNGQLLDGGHRIFSIIAAADPGDDEDTTGDNCLIVLGVDPTAFSSFDSNVSRKLKDACQVSNLTAETMRSSVINLYYSYKIGKFFVDKNFAPSASKGLQIGRHLGEDLERSLWFITAFYPSGCSLRRFSKAKFAFAHILCAQKDKAAADQYFYRLLTGVGLKSNGVIQKVHALWVTRTNANTQRYDTIHYLWSILFWGWNRFCEQEAAQKGKSIACQLLNVKETTRDGEKIKVYSMPVLKEPSKRRATRINKWYYGDARSNQGSGFKEREVDPAVNRAKVRAQANFDKARVKARDLDGIEAAIVRAKIDHRLRENVDADLFADD